MTVSHAINKIKDNYHNISRQGMFFGFSGGVDSSTMGVLMGMCGFNIKGFHAVCWDEGTYCTAPEDLRDALAITSKFSISLDVLDLRKEYSHFVFNPFLESYKKGYVTNIDIQCNQEIKFGFIFKHFKSKNFNILSTGHYASTGFLPTELTGGEKIKALKIPTDFNKDQTYFLSHIIRDPNIIENVFFPAGLFTKSEIRSLAVELGLVNAKKPDSQGICFIGNVNMRTFLKDYIKQSEGMVVDTTGKLCGTHSGVAFYTIGQRHGFKLKNYSSEPLYVIRKDPINNLLVIGARKDAFSAFVNIDNFFSILDLKTLQALISKKLVKARFRNLGKCISIKSLEKIADQKYKLNLIEAEFGLTPGQEVVFYAENFLIGYATIDY